jgi:hypothetical protein
LRTAGQPAELTITNTTIAKNTIVLATATPMFRAPRRSPRIRDPRSPRPLSVSALSVLLQDGGVRLARQPFGLNLGECAVALQ